MIIRLVKDAAGCEAGIRELCRDRELLFIGKDEALAAGMENEAIFVHAELSTVEAVSVSYACDTDGEKAIRTAYLEACDKTFLFRAFMTLLRELEKRGDREGFCIEEKVYLKRNGTMLDCSRNSVLSVETIKEYLRMQAAVGMNTMMLYTEDTYEVPEYPYFGAYRGRYSKEELQEVVAYAELFHIEMIPCIQTLAHLKNPLKWDAMRQLGLCDTEDILLVGSENVYTFIETCIRRTQECFRTKRVHLGMDEAWSLGLGWYLSINGYQTKAQIMSRHLDKVTEICKRLGVEPMIWSDMYLSMNAENGGYYGVALDKDLSDAVKPPKEVTLVYWDYYNMEQNFYEQYLRMHKQLSDKVIFAGGGWVWNGIAPNLTKAIKTTEAAMAACKEKGIEEAVCTMWQDDGAETPMAAGLLPILRFAEHGFSKEVTEEQLKEQFEFLTGADYEAFCLLDVFDHVPGRGDDGNPSKFLLYQDVLLGMFDEQVADWDASAYYAAVGEQLARLAEKKAGNGMDNVLAMYVKLAEALAIKGSMGKRLCDAYQKQDKRELSKIAAEEIPACMEKVQEYRNLRETVWNQESKIFGFEVIDIRINGLLGRLKTAEKRITEYVDGKLDKLPELEETRLPFRKLQEGENKPLLNCNNWQAIVSASSI